MNRLLIVDCGDCDGLGVLECEHCGEPGEHECVDGEVQSTVFCWCKNGRRKRDGEVRP
jgi:hypothetical protein